MNLRMLTTGKIQSGVKLSSLTSYHIGGPAKYLVYPNTIQELSRLIKFIKSRRNKFFILGNGTNIVAPDKGFNGIVISLKNFRSITRRDKTITCEAGADLNRLILYSIRHGLSGIENLSGIPGTLGGALRMNAGAYDSEISDMLKDIEVMDYNGNVTVLDKKSVRFSYRQAKNLYNKIILKARFRLHPGRIQRLMRIRHRIIKIRKKNHPWNKYSAGSVFKRPNRHFAGKLISQAGLKGYCIGGAEVSRKHAGFIINTGKAKAKDILALIRLIQKCIYKKFKVKLKLEQIIIKP